MPSERLEPALPAIKQLHTYAVDCTATRIGEPPFSSEYFISLTPKNMNSGMYATIMVPVASYGRKTWSIIQRVRVFEK